MSTQNLFLKSNKWKLNIPLHWAKLGKELKFLAQISLNKIIVNLCVLYIKNNIINCLSVISLCFPASQFQHLCYSLENSRSLRAVQICLKSSQQFQTLLLSVLPAPQIIICLHIYFPVAISLASFLFVYFLFPYVGLHDFVRTHIEFGNEYLALVLYFQFHQVQILEISITRLIDPQFQQFGHVINTFDHFFACPQQQQVSLLVFLQLIRGQGDAIATLSQLRLHRIHIPQLQTWSSSYYLKYLLLILFYCDQTDFFEYLPQCSVELDSSLIIKHQISQEQQLSPQGLLPQNHQNHYETANAVTMFGKDFQPVTSLWFYFFQEHLLYRRLPWQVQLQTKVSDQHTCLREIDQHLVKEIIQRFVSTNLLHLIQIYDHPYIQCQAAYQVFRCKARLSNQEECSLLVEGIINCLVILPSARQCLLEEASLDCVTSIRVAEDRALTFLDCFLCCQILTFCYSLKITIITSNQYGCSLQKFQLIKNQDQNLGILQQLSTEMQILSSNITSNQAQNNRNQNQNRNQGNYNQQQQYGNNQYNSNQYNNNNYGNNGYNNNGNFNNRNSYQPRNENGGGNRQGGNSWQGQGAQEGQSRGYYGNGQNQGRQRGRFNGDNYDDNWREDTRRFNQNQRWSNNQQQDWNQNQYNNNRYNQQQERPERKSQYYQNEPRNEVSDSLIRAHYDTDNPYASQNQPQFNQFNRMTNNYHNQRDNFNQNRNNNFNQNRSYQNPNSGQPPNYGPPRDFDRNSSNQNRNNYNRNSSSNRFNQDRNNFNNRNNYQNDGRGNRFQDFNPRQNNQRQEHRVSTQPAPTPQFQILGALKVPQQYRQPSTNTFLPTQYPQNPIAIKQVSQIKMSYQEIKNDNGMRNSEANSILAFPQFKEIKVSNESLNGWTQINGMDYQTFTKQGDELVNKIIQAFAVA